MMVTGFFLFLRLFVFIDRSFLRVGPTGSIPKQYFKISITITNSATLVTAMIATYANDLEMIWRVSSPFPTISQCRPE